MCVATLDLGQPIRLVVVLGGTEGGVEEDKQQDQPIECHRFDGGATVSATDSIPAAECPTREEEESEARERGENRVCPECPTVSELTSS